MALLDILPLVAAFLLAHCNKVACVVASLVYAIAGILIVNAFAAGIATSNPVAACLPRVIEFRWYLGSFAPSGMPASLAARALARAVVINPRVLLFDEPLSNLDAKLRVEMRSAIRAVQKKVGITTVYVTHDQEEALSISYCGYEQRGDSADCTSSDDL